MTTDSDDYGEARESRMVTGGQGAHGAEWIMRDRGAPSALPLHDLKQTEPVDLASQSQSVTVDQNLTTTFGNAGNALWRAVLADFELSEGELAILRSACLAADAIEDLTTVIAAEGAMVTTEAGTPKVNPALVERRQQQLTLGRLLVALRIPAGDEGEILDAPRTQRRPIRGFYGPRDVS